MATECLRTPKSCLINCILLSIISANWVNGFSLVKLFKKGDQVFGEVYEPTRGGAHAEYIAMPENADIIVKLANMT